MIMLKINNLTAGYKAGDPILEDINLEINTGETLLIIGKNGAGKSTLVKSLINNLPFMEGEIIFDNSTLFNSIKNIKVETSKIINNGIGYFLQGGRVFPQLTVEENLSIAGKYDYQNSKYFRNFNLDLKTILKNNLMNLKEKANYLSLGQKHILALIMVLLKEPKLLILDEPTAGLDDKNVDLVIDIITKLKKGNELSILLVEHRTEEIRSLADRRVEIIDGKIKT